MKSKDLKILIFICLLIPLSMVKSTGQGTSLQGFSVKASPGALAYYGDLSSNNSNIPNRIIKGSKFGIGGSIIKQFSPFFSIQAQYMAGSLYTAAPDNTYFAGSLSEFSLSARIDPIRLWPAGKKSALSPYFSVGVGTIGFRSVHREMETNVVLLPSFGYADDGITNTKRPTAMSMPVALGLSYRILPNFQIELEHSLRWTNTDLIDCVKGTGTKNDMYSLTSLGLRYTLPSRSVSGIHPDKGQNNPPLAKTVKPADPVKDASPEINIYVACEIPEKIQVGQTFDVNLRINKGSYNGPAKLTQTFPDGFTALEGPARIGSFSFINQNVIIEWEKMPADSIITLNYQVKVGENLAGSETVKGRFDYKQPMENPTIRFNKSVFVDNTSVLKEKENQADLPVITHSTNGNIKPAKSLEGIEFRVQCGAFRDNASADKQLASKYRITEIIQEEFTDGWFKYTVGSFRTYEEAAAYRDQFIERTRILSSFIVAYKDGRRLAKITDAFK